jgi:UPF0755 protein
MRRLSTIFAFAAALLVMGGVYVGFLYYGEEPSPQAERVEIRVLPGSYLSDVERMLVENGLLKHRRLFRWVAVATGKDKKVQAGRYVFLRGTSIARMLDKLARAEFEITRLVIPEGFLLREIAATVFRDVEVDSAQFHRLALNPDFARELGINAPTLEGYLFPDTYNMSWPLTSRDVTRLMVRRFREVYDEHIALYAKSTGLSTNEIVTLASIVQAEAQRTSEMPRISAVYYNRMRKGMRLEADPTVAYALGGVRRGLRYSDLKMESPYNTYRTKGLPPGPICSPGRAALEAAVRPLEGCDDLYFVSAGDGTHIFSRTHDDHVKAKRLVRAMKDTIPDAKPEPPKEPEMGAGEVE